MGIEELKRQQDSVLAYEKAVDEFRARWHALRADFLLRGLPEIARVVDQDPSLRGLRLSWTLGTPNERETAGGLRWQHVAGCPAGAGLGWCGELAVVGGGLCMNVYALYEWPVTKTESAHVVAFSFKSDPHLSSSRDFEQGPILETPTEEGLLPIVVWMRAQPRVIPGIEKGTWTGGPEYLYPYWCVWRGRTDNRKLVNAMLSCLHGRLPEPEFVPLFAQPEWRKGRARAQRRQTLEREGLLGLFGETVEGIGPLLSVLGFLTFSISSCVLGIATPTLSFTSWLAVGAVGAIVGFLAAMYITYLWW